jgi:uncharacterized membrane protein
MKPTSSEDKLELLISYILIIGVISSVAIEAVGILSYYFANRDLSIVFQPQYTLKGTDFFSYSAMMLQSLISGSWTPFQILALGIIVLMITPYVRVVASVIYFGAVRNPKYVAITAFVLVILTASLLAH